MKIAGGRIPVAPTAQRLGFLVAGRARTLYQARVNQVGKRTRQGLGGVIGEMASYLGRGSPPVEEMKHLAGLRRGGNAHI